MADYAAGSDGSELPAQLGKAFQPDLQPYCRVEPSLTLTELAEVKKLLTEKNTLNFESAKVKDKDGKPTGTFSASAANAAGDHSASSMFGSWFRDNALIAYALYITEPYLTAADDAVACIKSIADFLLTTQCHKMELVIQGMKDVKGAEPTWMDRPHIRFIGSTGLEDPKWYNHKQNDALGYFLFTRATLALGGKMPMTGEHLKVCGQLFDFLRTIESWSDLDGGHWEEHSAQHSSSIGPQLAAVRLFKELCAKEKYLLPCKEDTLDVLQKNLESELAKVLPNEIVMPKELERDADGACIFLCYPLNVVSDEDGLKILDRMKKIYGHIGTCRYRKDSYWCRDYGTLYADPTKHFTDEELKERDANLKYGEEAQWLLFDPIVSAYYGKLYQNTKNPTYLKYQQLFLSRSLAAVSGDDCKFGGWHACEAYYISDDKWVSNDNCPLVWTKADMLLALYEMEKSLKGPVKKRPAGMKRPASAMS